MQCVHTGRGTSDSCKKKKEKKCVWWWKDSSKMQNVSVLMECFFVVSCYFTVSLSLIRCGPLKSCCSLTSCEAKMSTEKNCIIALIKMLLVRVTQLERNMVKYQQEHLVSASWHDATAGLMLSKCKNHQNRKFSHFRGLIQDEILNQLEMMPPEPPGKCESSTIRSRSRDLDPGNSQSHHHR